MIGLIAWCLIGDAVPLASAAQARRVPPAPTPQPSAREPQTPIEHNNRGVELGNKGQWSQAIREHELALEADPYNKEFRVNLSAAQLRYGDLLAAKGDYYGATKQYHGALYADENNLSAERNLDACLKHLGKNPDDVKARLSMGQDAETSGDYETAIVEYRRCGKISDDGSYHARLGGVYRKAGKDVQAFNEFKIAVTRSWSAEYRDDKAFGLGSVHRMLGDILKEYADIAFKDGRQAIALKRLVNAGIEYRRAVTLNSGDLDAAQSLLEVARQAVATNPCIENELTLAGAYQLAGDMDHARMEYDKCYRLDPNNPTLGIARRSFYAAVVRSPTTSPAFLQSTMSKIETQLKKTPDDAELLYVYGRGKEALGDQAAALEYYHKAAAINPYVNPDLQQGLSRLGQAPAGSRASSESLPAGNASSNVSSGSKQSALAQDSRTANPMQYAEFETLIRSGDIGAAEQGLMKFVQTHPQDAHAWLLLGNACEKKGNLDQAAANYRQAKNLKDLGADEALRQINTSRVQPLLAEARQYMASKNWVAASASLHDALTLAPEMPVVHRTLAEVLKQMGDAKESGKELKKAQELERE